MRRDDRIRLQHMLDAAQDAVSFIQGRVQTDLSNDRMLLLALVKSIEIVGEAAGQLSADTREMAPHLPWRAMIAMRNRLVHGYFDVDPDLVWKTATDELPALIVDLRALLDE
jgi:uncharacterized protein with HEPN domain